MKNAMFLLLKKWPHQYTKRSIQITAFFNLLSYISNLCMKKYLVACSRFNKTYLNIARPENKRTSQLRYSLKPLIGNQYLIDSKLIFQTQIHLNCHPESVKSDPTKGYK